MAHIFSRRLTSDAGPLWLREVDRQIGLTEAINGCRQDSRDPRYVVHEQQAKLAQRMFAIAAGYEDLNDHQTRRDDPALQTAAGKVPEPDDPLASPSTRCRLEQRVTRRALVDDALVRESWGGITCSASAAMRSSRGASPR